MFLKNNFRPAFAVATEGGQTAKNRKMKNEAIMRNEADTDSFGSFDNSAKGAGSAGNAKKGGFNAKPVIIAVAALVAVVLLIVLIVAIAAGGGKDVKFEDNAFVAFSDENDVYRIAVNGKTLAEYDGEIELTVAADRSFAYVEETTEDGQRLYVVTPKEQTELTTSPVTKILAKASLKPGAVWVDEDNEGIYLYTDAHGPERMLRNIDQTYAMDDEHFFTISGDGETVVYTKIVESNTGSFVDRLYVYNDHSDRMLITKHYPEAVSDDGSFVFTSATAKDKLTASLYVIPLAKDDYSASYLIAENYNSIVDMNTEGNEIVFTTLDTDSISTYAVSFNPKKMDQEILPTKIGKGAVYYPVDPAGKTARFSTFEECYFQCDLSVDLGNIFTGGEVVNSPVYFLNKKYESQLISRYAGKFDPESKYFYSVSKSGKLTYLDLTDSDAMSVTIPSSEGVIDYAVTQKGNVYLLNDNYQLMFYDVSKDKITRINDSVEAISMYTYSNTLYFTTTDNLSVFCTEEGSKMEKASLGKNTALNGLPIFSDANSKKTFAGFYNTESEEWCLIYTANGKSFKSIGTCATIEGMGIPTRIQDIINVIKPPVSSDTSSETTDTESAAE